MVLRESEDLLRETALNTLSADIGFAAFAVYLYSDFLEIRHKPAFIKVVSVTHIISYHRSFPAYRAFFTHITPPYSIPAIDIN